jgi:hypothetical protein
VQSSHEGTPKWPQEGLQGFIGRAPRPATSLRRVP